MAEYDDTIVSEHDGIQEQDNKLPRWWVLLFQITTVFAFLYLMWYHVLGFGRDQERKYDDMVAQARAAQAARQQQVAESLDLSAPSMLPAVLAEGGALYQSHCASCHTADGHGLIGPNLTDAYWIHGAAFADTMQVIANGVLEKGMQAWKDSLSLRQRHAVASYIYSIRGTNPPNPKEPQGERVAGSDSPTFQL